MASTGFLSSVWLRLATIIWKFQLRNSCVVTKLRNWLHLENVRFGVGVALYEVWYKVGMILVISRDIWGRNCGRISQEQLWLNLKRGGGLIEAQVMQYTQFSVAFCHWLYVKLMAEYIYKREFKRFMLWFKTFFATIFHGKDNYYRVKWK